MAQDMGYNVITHSELNFIRMNFVEITPLEMYELSHTLTLTAEAEKETLNRSV